MKLEGYKKALAKPIRQGQTLMRNDKKKDQDGDPCHACFNDRSVETAKQYGWVEVKLTKPKAVKDLPKPKTKETEK